MKVTKNVQVLVTALVWAANMLTWTASAQSDGAETTALTTSMSVLDDKRLLNIGDTLSFRIVEDRSEAIPLVVGETGEVELPYIGRLMARGRTCRQFANSIKSQLDKDYYYDSTVIVALNSFSQRAKGVVYMRGAIASQSPIAIPADGELMLSKAILRAGGFTTYSNKRKVTVLRKKPGMNESETLTVDMKEVLEKGKLDGDIALQPDDIVTVHQRGVVF
jgi:polysaccharide export outer membrane protein